MQKGSWVVVSLLLILCSSSLASLPGYEHLSKEQMYSQAEVLYQRYQAGEELQSHEMDLLHATGFVPDSREDGLDEFTGPDGFGYMAYNQDEPEGYAFDWIDLENNGGTEITGYTNSDDGYAGPFAFPDGFSFPFYAETKTEFYLGTNGSIFFSEGSGSLGHTFIPNASAPNDYIPFWQRDMHMGYTGGTRTSDAYYDVVTVDGEDAMVIEVLHISEYGSNGADNHSVDAQMIFFANGDIVIQYQSVGSSMNAYVTIGIENSDGSMGTQWYYDNTGDLPVSGDEYTIFFDAPQPDATIDGFVYDSDTQEGIADATVWYGGFSATTGPDGSYEFPSMYSGSYDVTVIAEGYHPYRSDAQVDVVDGANTFDYNLDPFPPLTFSEDFEAGPGNWRLDENNSTTYDWEWGAPTSYLFTSTPHSGENVWATNLDGGFSYQNDAFTMLTADRPYCVDDPGAVMTFWAWDDHRSSYNGGFNIQASTDGEIWQTLDTIDPPYNANNLYTNYEDVWATDNGPWRQYTVDLSAYDGQMVLLRFRHIYDNTYYYYAQYWFGTAIDDIDVYGAAEYGWIEGTVTNLNTGDPVPEFTASLVYNNEVVWTEDFTNGAYIFDDLPPSSFAGTYGLVFNGPGYVTDQTADNITVNEGAGTTQDFELEPNPPVDFDLFVTDTNDPANPIEGVTVSIPSVGESATTDANGMASFTGVPEYTYDFSFQPVNVAGVTPYYHDMVIEVEVITGMDDPTVELDEVLPPSDVVMNANSNNFEFWITPPDNHLQPIFLQQRIDMLENTVSQMQQQGITGRKLQDQVDELERWRHAYRNRLETGDEEELDELADFQGYWYTVDGEMIHDPIWPSGFDTETYFQYWNVMQGREYTFTFTADYGYGEDFLIFTDPGVSGRAYPDVNYQYNDGIDFEWIEINPNADAPDYQGTQLTNWTGGTDDGREEVLFNTFTFNYYGTDYTNLWVNTNGWAAFGEDPNTNSYSNTGFPNTFIPNNIVAPWWDDLNAIYGDGIFYYEDEANDRFILQFSHGSWSNTFHYQVVLYGDGTIHYNYNTAESGWSGTPNVGLENSDGTTGVEYPYWMVYDGLSIEFTYSGPVGDWGAIDGFVYNSQTMEPISSADVIATDADGNEFSGVSDYDGHYTIPCGQAGGPYELIFTHPQYETGVLTNQDFTQGEEQLDVADTYLDPLGSIEGTVTNTAYGEPVHGATVTVDDGALDQVWEVTTDENGYFLFDKLFDRNGSFDLTFEANGYYSGQTFNATFGQDEFTITRDKELTPYGSLEGTITDENEQPIADVVVLGWGDDNPEERRTTLTDENGEYAFTRMLPRTDTYSLRVMGDGYVAQTAEELAFGPTDYTITQDFSLVAVDNTTAPGIGAVDEKHDTGFDITLLEPGNHGLVETYQYDTGFINNWWNMGNPGDQDIYGVFYQPDEGYVLTAELAFDNDAVFGNAPDGTYDDVVVMLLGDNDGEPDIDNVLWTSDPVGNSADDMWVVVEPGLPVPEDGFWICYYDVGPGTSALLFDNNQNYWDQNAYTMDGGQSWHFNWVWGGDPLIRTTVFHPALDPSQQQVLGSGLLEHTTPPKQPEVTRHGELNGGESYYGVHAGYKVPNARLRPGLLNDVLVANGAAELDELDEFQGFNVWYSTDGAEYTQSNADPVTADPYFVEVGSEFENQDVWYYAEAVNDGVSSNATSTYTTQFSMEPAAPSDVVGQYVDPDVILTWTDPTTNFDGSNLTDLTEINVYRNGAVLATVAPGVETYSDQIPVDFAGAAIYWVTAVDEAGNESETQAFYNAGVFGTPDYELTFEPDTYDIFADPYGPWNPDVWQKAAPTAGPQAAYNGQFCWSTYPDGNYQNNNWEMVLSEPMAVLGTNAVFNYWHWYNYEGNWDGYTVMVTTDNGNTWDVIEPAETYSYGSINSSGYPAFSGSNGTWEQVNFSLSEYYTEDEYTFVQIGFLHTTDGSVNNYFGVAFDDMNLYGLGPVSDYEFAPLPFDMATPDDGETVWTNGPTLEWEPSDDYNPADMGNIVYNLEWSYNSDFSGSTVVSGITSNWYTFDPDIEVESQPGNDPSGDPDEGVGMLEAGKNRTETARSASSSGELDDLGELDELLTENSWVYWRVQAEDTGGLTTNANGYDTGMSFYVNAELDHFTPVEPTDNVFTVQIDAATIDAMPLEIGDEVALFDGSTCVGGAFIKNNPPFPVTFEAYGTDGDDIGYTEGNDLWFKIYSAQFDQTFWGLAGFIDGDETFVTGGGTEVVLVAMRNVNQSIDLAANYWNLVSFPVDPVDGSTDAMFGGLTSLQTVMQGNGNTYIPGVIDDIGNVSHSNGYRVFCTEAEQLAYAGMSLDYDGVEYGLTQSQWNWMGYPFDFALDVTVGLADIAENLEIVRDDQGGFWIPAYNINTMGNLEPGEGYEAWTDATVFFEYGGGGHSQILANPEEVWVERRTADAPDGTGYPWTLLVELDQDILEAGASQIAVYDGNTLVGKSYVMEDKPLSVVTTWRGFDELNLSGYTPGHLVKVEVLDEGGAQIRTRMLSEWLRFDESPYGAYSLGYNPLPKEFELSEGFPNPFNPAVKLKIALPNAGKVDLAVFNILGQEVYRSLQHYEAGYHYLHFDASRSGRELTSGVYFLQVQYEGKVNVRKVVLVK